MIDTAYSYHDNSMFL